MPGVVAPSPPPMLVDETGVVAADVPCKGCSYNLRGLGADSKCPECATAIELSLRGDLLRYSDPAWLDRVGLGTLLSLCGMLAMFFIAIRTPIIYFLRPMQYSLGLIATLLSFSGTWLLTMPDPGAHEERGMAMARTIARIGLAVTVGRAVVLFFSASLSPTISALVGLMFVVAAIARTAAEFARLYYIGRLALRIPDEKLSRRATFLIRTFGMCMGTYSIVSSVITFIMLTLKQRPNWLSPAFVLMRQVSQLAWVGVMIFSITYVFFLIRFGNALRVQRTLARALRKT